MTEQIRGILWEHGRLPVDVEALNHQSDLYESGLTSQCSWT